MTDVTTRGLGSDWAPASSEYRASLRPRYESSVRTSRYLTMRDGTKIAIDVHLPRGAEGSRLPTILRQTRYFRSFDVRPWVAMSAGADVFDPSRAAVRNVLVSHGYAFVDVDARGSGASFGVRPHPWSKDEVRDGHEIVQWITEQPWSDGIVGATGVSYDGTAAEMLATTQHPALRAVAPRYSCFDVFTDVAFPGGLHLAWFTEAWSRVNAALDRNHPEEILDEVLALRLHGGADPAVAREGTWQRALAELTEVRAIVSAAKKGMRLAMGGVRPVDDDPRGEQRDRAIASRTQNFSVHEGALGITYRDDVVTAPTAVAGTDEFSPSTKIGRLRASGIAVLAESGWLDGAYQHAAIKRHWLLRGADSRLLLGPWSHGGELDMSPFAAVRPTRFDHVGEQLRFFDHHLRARDTGLHHEPRVRYFTMGSERWQTSSEWPPKESRARAIYLSSQKSLSFDAPKTSGEDRYQVDRSSGSGRRARWRSLLSPAVHVDYPDRARDDRGLLVYESAPLDRALELTGHPIVVLHIVANAPDAVFFAYLEDVDPHGHVTYVTQGQLRALHRRLSIPLADSIVPERSYLRRDAMPLIPGESAEIAFDLLPISYQLSAGHRLRLALAGADKDHFTTPTNAATRWTIRWGAASPSRLILPIVERP